MTAVAPSTPARRGELVDVLTRAFATDPVVTWLIGASRADDRRRRRFFRLLVAKTTVALGGCDLADGGAAVWYPPSTYATTSTASLTGLPGALGAFGRRIGAAGQADAELRRHHPAEPHWYLQFVGVVPERAGRGIGTALLEHRLATIDAGNGAAYLESSLERNLPLYERLGFVVREEVHLGPGAPPEWLMWRAPRT